uniref:Ovule protein n=1 Tax=Strongyloides venezuelensis TaxID=75913 RepID=A0A0K0FEQ2_STRVS
MIKCWCAWGYSSGVERSLSMGEGWVENVSHHLHPTIAQLVERRTVDLVADILRSLVRIRLVGDFLSTKILLVSKTIRLLENI